MIKTVLTVEGMSCKHCVKAVTTAVTALPGTGGVLVDLSAKTVTVEYEPSVTSVDDIKRRIEDQGYEIIT